MLTPTNAFLLLGFVTSVPNFIYIYIIVILRRLDLFDKSTGNRLNVSGNLLAIYSAGFVDTLMYTRCSSD